MTFNDLMKMPVNEAKAAFEKGIPSIDALADGHSIEEALGTIDPHLTKTL